MQLCIGNAQHGRTNNCPESGRGLGHVTPTIFGSTVGYPSESLASCWQPCNDAQDRASECPYVKNYKWRLNPVWHRMPYTNCTHMATVGIRGL